MCACGVDVAPETLHRVLQAERGAAGGDKDRINRLNQKLGGERVREAIAHPQLDTRRLARSDRRERVADVAMDHELRCIN